MKSARNYNSNWNKILINEQPVSPARLKQGNFYKILLYKYADGEVKSLTGPNSSFIFFLGRYSKNGVDYIATIKLKSVDPKYFFEDIRLAFKSYPVTEQQIEKVYENIDDTANDEFSRLLKKIQLDGKNIFSIIKTKKRIYDGYREYLLKNIKNLSYLDIDPDFLKNSLTKDSKKLENQKKIEKELNSRDVKTVKQLEKQKIEDKNKDKIITKQQEKNNFESKNK